MAGKKKMDRKEVTASIPTEPEIEPSGPERSTRRSGTNVRTITKSKYSTTE